MCSETAVTMVFNDLSQAANRGHISALCLLGVTFAFDTVHHNLLLLAIFNSHTTNGSKIRDTNKLIKLQYKKKTSNER